MPPTNGFHQLDSATGRPLRVPAGIDGSGGVPSGAARPRSATRLRRRPPPGHRCRDAGEVAWSRARGAPVRWMAAGEPVLGGGHLPADALQGRAGSDRVEQGLRQVADGPGVATERLRDRALMRAGALWAYEVDGVEPEGRLMPARSLAGLAER